MLGVAVIDEQHRFGVEQRDLLRAKGDSPDVLVMTATPIPRTAAMLIYGDLDKTELRELPAGRSPIATEVVGPAARSNASRCTSRCATRWPTGARPTSCARWSRARTKLEARAATEELRAPRRPRSSPASGSGCCTARCPPPTRRRRWRAFRDGDIDVLVATTVIEVGVDVPNATVMVIEDADRFGSLQLHQLRGRIGRGAHASCCYLLAEPTTPQGEARMEAMAESGDGFELAERDLAIRGAGEVFGERQAGWTDLKLGRLPARRADRARDSRDARRRADPRRRPRPRRATHDAAARGEVEGPPRRRRRFLVQELVAR